MNIGTEPNCHELTQTIVIIPRQIKTHRDFFLLYLEHQRSMSARQGYHGPKFWAPDRRGDIRRAVRTLVQAFGVQDPRHDWPGPGWQSRHQPGRAWRREPRRFANTPPRRPFQSPREPSYWRPRYVREERWGSAWQRPSPVQRFQDCKSRALPRRGPPVAAIKVPRWYRQVVRNERQPRGSNPRGTLRGGPKGQPEIRRETLEAVCVEVPKGQPRKHRRRSRKPPSRKPSERREERNAQRVPLSSRWTKAGKRLDGAALGPFCVERGPIMGRRERRGSCLP